MKKSFVKVVGSGGLNPPGSNLGFVRMDGDNISIVRNKSVATAFNPKRLKKFMAEYPNSPYNPQRFVVERRKNV